MRHLSKILLPSTLLATAAATSAAHAQLDVNPPLPNVLLLIDTSGSMEHMISGAAPESAGATCVPGTTTDMNRWATLVSVLTGTVENYSCTGADRSGAAFKNEYRFNGTDPYDANYYLPFHRLLSNGCTAGPGTMPLAWPGWPNGAIKYHPWNDAAIPCDAPGWQQSNDGILDVFRDRVRFGLMTFDTLPDPSTGANGTNSDASGGMQGMWSYFLNWNGTGSPASGNPPNCTAAPFEVGARNPSAPPWEGRLLSFGGYDAPLSDVQQSNDHLQEAIVAMRPYGATPLAGMMADARDFLLNDTSTDPSTNLPFGPSGDPYYGGGCRKTYIIVLSDGEPNQDLEPNCQQTGNPDGHCPYPKAYETAHELASLSTTALRVQTFAVGFALSSAAGLDCNLLTPADLDETSPSAACYGATGDLKACCTLGRIASEGGTNKAYFADDIGSLRAVLSNVLSLVAAGSTSRTLPVSSSAATTGSVQGNAEAAAYQFVTSFDATPGVLWTGNLERKRFVCETVGGVLQATLKDIDATKGDDFEANLNTGTPTRQFFTVVGDTTGGTIYSKNSVRPSLTTDDGLGLYGGTPTTLQDGATFATTLSTSTPALGINAVAPAACTTRLKTSDAALCAERLMRWEVGETNAQPTETRDGNEFGSIYHSTPTVVGPPRDFLRDESYSNYAVLQSTRPTILYTATTDGQLHAFKVASNDPSDTLKVDDTQNNELWSFFPPHVLPRLLSTYNQQAFLVDGAPVLRDVVFDRTEGNVATAAWHNVLVAAGGAGGSFYYALDVTNPAAPVFLWQLSTDTNGAALFGSETPTPAITTISLLDGTSVKETAVAVLAGGTAPLLAGTCPRQQTTWTNIQPTDSTLQVRANVRCWGQVGTTGPSRSVTVVRLDTGEVLMNFRGASADGPAGLPSTRVKVVPFDSPITGVPVPSTTDPGEVADRVYVGDADGTLWRLNLSNPDPANWTVDLAWDAYALSTDGVSSSQPIQTPPIISVDPIGNTVILFSTGDQETFTSSTGVQTRIWSLLERPASNVLQTTENWYIPFEDGKRVTGPISLFNSVAYFSTFTPSSVAGGACANGTGAVWGVDYIQHEATANGPRPRPRYVPDITQPSVVVSSVDQPTGTVVFGVSVTQTPSCADTQSFTDPYLGLSHQAPTVVTPTKFSLVFQTGQGGTATENSKTNTQTQELLPPRQTTRIDSWATIIE